jgi:hypothetical protein
MTHSFTVRENFVCEGRFSRCILGLMRLALQKTGAAVGWNMAGKYTQHKS